VDINGLPAGDFALVDSNIFIYHLAITVPIRSPEFSVLSPNLMPKIFAVQPIIQPDLY
jgi:hypothetical protein